MLNLWIIIACHNINENQYQMGVIIAQWACVLDDYVEPFDHNCLSSQWKPLSGVGFNLNEQLVDLMGVIIAPCKCALVNKIIGKQLNFVTV